MKKLLAIAVASLLLMGGSLGASAQPVVDKKFSNCSELNRQYPGGVAKSSKVTNKGGATKKVPTVNAKVYAENKSKDRDNDGIACEK